MPYFRVVESMLTVQNHIKSVTVESGKLEFRVMFKYMYTYV